jgi:aminopeptidase N
MKRRRAPHPGRTLGLTMVLVVLVGCGRVPGVSQTLIPEPVPIRAGRASPAGTYGAIDVLRYEVEIGLPAPGGHEITGRADLLLTPVRTVDEAVLDFTGLAITQVTVDAAAVRARLEEGRLHVPLVDVAPGDTARVTVVYRGTPDDGLILADNVHGRPSAFVDNWPNRTRFWLPSVDHPSDKATFGVTVHAPEAWRVVSNGSGAEPVTGPATEDGTPRRTWRWRTDVAVSPYNFVFGAAQMDVVPLGVAACGRAPASPRGDGCVEVSAWLFPEDTGQASLSFRRAADMVEVYSDMIGPYPFEKLAHVESSTRFGGMENASAIFYTEDGLASGENMEGTVAHETAHQWFGDSVTEVDWPELWLSEGFATYFGHLYFEWADGVEIFRTRMEESRREYLTSDVTGRPVIEARQDLFELLNSNNYPKGGWVLHMLRGIVGDEAFFSGIRGYYAEHAGGNASTADLRAAMEAASGRELGWFFEQWLRKPGYPVLELEHRWDATAGEVVITLRQVQAPSWPTFRLPMELEIQGADGTTTRHRVELSARSQEVRIPAPAAPTAVVADPDGWVLKRMAGEQIRG